MARTTILVARHGQTDWNRTGRYHGQADIALNEVGRRQAAALAGAWHLLRPDLVYSSPLARARNTASAVSRAGGVPMVVDDRLAEVDVGTWAGLTEEQVYALDPAFRDAHASGADYRHSPEGETPSECAARVADVLDELATTHRGRTVLVVSHAYAIRVGVARLLGLDLNAGLALAGLFNCAWAELEPSSPRWRLVGWNLTDGSVPDQRSGEVLTV